MMQIYQIITWWFVLIENVIVGFAPFPAPNGKHPVFIPDTQFCRGDGACDTGSLEPIGSQGRR